MYDLPDTGRHPTCWMKIIIPHTGPQNETDFDNLIVYFNWFETLKFFQETWIILSA